MVVYEKQVSVDFEIIVYVHVQHGSDEFSSFACWCLSRVCSLFNARIDGKPFKNIYSLVVV